MLAALLITEYLHQKYVARSFPQLIDRYVSENSRKGTKVFDYTVTTKNTDTLAESIYRVRCGDQLLHND
jgi:hypothetical protein